MSGEAGALWVEIQCPEMPLRQDALVVGAGEERAMEGGGGSVGTAKKTNRKIS